MHKDRTCSCRGERGERGKFDEKTREGCWRLSMAPKCNSTTGSQCRSYRMEAAFVSLDQDGTANEEDIELAGMAPKRDLVRADL